MFREYYMPTNKEFKKLWNDCLFVLDTNILLNFYRYSEKTNVDFFSILDKISDRLWIPYQVAFEYQKNRIGVISDKMGAYKELDKIIDNQANNLKNAFKIAIQGKGFEKHPFIEIKEIENKIDKCFSEIKVQIKENEEKHPNLIKNDTIRERLSILLLDKIGQNFPEDRLKEIYKDGEKRYEEKIPPGFSDQDKKGNARYGDLIIWLEIIEKAKQKNQPVIFVVDDGKEDWWNIVRGKTIGPRPELMHEFFSEVKLQFYMYKSERFTSCAEKHLGLKFDSNTVKEIREVSKEKRNIPVDLAITTFSELLLKGFLSKSGTLDNFDKINISDYKNLLSKKRMIEKSIVDTQIKMLDLQNELDESLIPGHFLPGEFSKTLEISKLKAKISHLKDVRDDINNLIQK